MHPEASLFCGEFITDVWAGVWILGALVVAFVLLGVAIRLLDPGTGASRG